jgi:predicted CopG family antitoxin
MNIMARNIALADDVYKLLKNMKRAGESFSDLIRRLLKTRSNLSDLIGSSGLSVEEWCKMLDLKKKQALLDRQRIESLIEKSSGTN